MNKEDFRKNAHEMVDWMADYLEEKDKYPVSPNVNPRDIYNQLPDQAPEKGEAYKIIFDDFKSIILPGMTHWQHPSFFGYFPANNSEPSILAEMLISTLGAQCMSWITSPAATELEEKVLDWLRDAKGICSTWKGVIQDTASTATLSALLAARERASNYKINERGFKGDERYRVYSSEHVHSSIDKALKISGIGQSNLVRIPVDENFAMIPAALDLAIRKDLEAGYYPLCVVSALGTTSSTAIDPISSIGEISQRYALWHHIDAAYAGTAMLLPEYQWMIDGHEKADSYVFNPHKWMFTNFDCSVLYLKEPQYLVKTFSLTPEYLKSSLDGEVNNYRDWGIQLGRRFRALKLWFVIRCYGLEGIRRKLRFHLLMTENLVKEMKLNQHIQILAPVPLNVICFRYHDSHYTDEELNIINEKWMTLVNFSGKAFFTHTKLDGKYAIRWVIAQTDVQEFHIKNAWKLLQDQLSKAIKHVKKTENRS